jgi:hypothetical protein
MQLRASILAKVRQGSGPSFGCSWPSAHSTVQLAPAILQGGGEAWLSVSLSSCTAAGSYRPWYIVTLSKRKEQLQDETVQR